MATQTGRNVRVEIAATYGAAKTVSAISKASPGVCTTSVAHSMTDGTIGYFSDDLAGMEELAGAAFSVDGPVSTTFNIEGEDTSTYGTFSSGTFIPVATWATLSTATSYEISDSAPDQIDATTLLSRIKLQEAGLLANQTITFGNLSDAQLSAFTLLKNAAKANGGYVVGRITLSNGERRIFRGQPSLPGESLSVGQKATNNLQILVKGFVGMLPA